MITRRISAAPGESRVVLLRLLFPSALQVMAAGKVSEVRGPRVVPDLGVPSHSASWLLKTKRQAA